MADNDEHDDLWPDGAPEPMPDDQPQPDPADRFVTVPGIVTAAKAAVLIQKRIG